MEQEEKSKNMEIDTEHFSLMRAVFGDNDKKFSIRDSKGKVRGKLGAVFCREKGTTDKNELYKRSS